MPSKRFWAKRNPRLDYIETVKKTEFFIKNYNYKKFIHISSISARCEKNTVYGKNKKKSESLVKKLKNFLIIRLGPMYGDKLTKGVLIDMLDSKIVFINKNSKYSFTNVNWIAQWVNNNLYKKKGLIELGSNDFIKLKDIAIKIKSNSKFRGRLDNQIIKSKRIYDTNSKEVYNFLLKKNKDKN